MTRWPRLFLVPTCTLAIAFSARSAAQTAAPNAGASKPEPATLISLTFPGGTVSGYLKAVRDAAKDVNVVLSSPEAGELPIPAVHLQSVDLTSAVRVVEGEYRVHPQGGYAVGVRYLAPSVEGAKPVFQVTAERQGRLGGAPGEVQVWTLSDLLAGSGKPDAVLTAVETAVGLLGDTTNPAQIRFHESTGLLVVMGDPRQLDAVQRVINALREGARRQPAAGDPAEAIAGLFEWIAHMKELDSAQVVAENARMREELQRKDQRIQELENRLGKSARP